jgi:hypothetical protein
MRLVSWTHPPYLTKFFRLSLESILGEWQLFGNRSIRECCLRSTGFGSFDPLIHLLGLLGNRRNILGKSVVTCTETGKTQTESAKTGQRRGYGCETSLDGPGAISSTYS